MTIVTGGAGFIGRNLVAALNRRGQTDLLLVDLLGETAKWRNLRGLVFEDIIAPGDLLGWLERPDRPPVTAIAHLGACSSTTAVDADFLLANNYRYTRDLATWALAHEVRFVYASSAATYGNGALGYSDLDAVTERLEPLNMYGYSKHLFDLWALHTGLFDRIVGLKFFNVYGPFEDHKESMRSVVAKAHEQIAATGRLSLFRSYREDVADGAQRRDFVYVDDAVATVLHFLDHPELHGLFNCGTGLSRSWLDLATAVFAAMGKPADVEFVDMPESIRAHYQYFTEADTTKLAAAGLAAPFSTLEQGVQRYVTTHLATQSATR